MARLYPENEFIATDGGRFQTIVMARGPAAASLTIGLQRQSSDGKTWVSVANGGVVGVGETLRAIADGMAPFKTVAFHVVRASVVYLRQQAVAGAGGGANVVFSAPPIGDNYVLMLEVDNQTQAFTTFNVAAQGDRPPDAPPDNPNSPLAWLSQIKGVLIVGGLIVAGIYLLPIVTSYVPRGQRG